MNLSELCFYFKLPIIMIYLYMKKNVTIENEEDKASFE